jgi:tetratricopeptide (TPR) repeat protein
LPDSEVNQINVIDARTRLALYFININRHVEARAAVGPIVDIAIGINYQEKLPAIFIVLGTFCIMFEEAYSEGFGYLEKAISIAGEVGDYYTLWLSRYFLGWHLSWDCDFERGIYNLKKCLETSISAKNIHGETVVNSSMSVSAYLFKGDIDIGFETTQTSLKISKDSGDIFLKGLSYTANGIANLFKGTLNEAQNSLLKGSVFCEKADLNSWRAFAFGFLGNFYHHDGKYEKAEACFQKAIAGLKSFQICQSWAYLWELLIVRARILNGQPVDYNNLIRSYDNVKVKILEGWVARLIGDILLRVENQGTARAEEWIKTAIDADKRNGTRWNLGMDYALYAEFFKRNGDFSRAREQLGKAIDIFKGCGADGWVEKYEKELASLQ